MLFPLEASGIRFVLRLERKNKTTGGGTIAALLDSSQCINAGMATTADKCQAGACVHMHGCPGQGGGPADLFHFDASSSTLVQETCAPKALCIVAAADGTLALGACPCAMACIACTMYHQVL